MTEHKGASFVHSCMKLPLDPYSRQPIPHYERPNLQPKMRKPAERSPSKASTRNESSIGDYNDFIDFVSSIPDYREVHHLSDEQFKQQLDYLKRKQRMILRNLRSCLEQAEDEARPRSGSRLELKGKRCNFEESRSHSPLLYPSGSFSCLAEDQDLLTYRWKEREERKEAKTRLNEEIVKQDWRSGSESKSESPESEELDLCMETKSLPPTSPKRWHPTLPKPFSFTLREDAEKYMNMVEQQAAEECEKSSPSKKNPVKKRRVRPVPLTSKIPLYEKLMAAKEERSRLVREESALSLLSQVRPFKLECDRRALRALTRSSPELSACKRIRNARGATAADAAATFKAKPVPRNLFSTRVYDRMLEDEYFRNLQKRIRSAELLRTSSLPPSMARRDRCKSASLRSSELDGDSVALSRGTPLASERCRSSAMTSTLPPHGNNLAAILRAQASREKLERELQEKLEEKRRERMIRLRKALIGRKPAWRALRSAARHEHERDLDFRAALRRDEAREQAERHRLQMEMMLDRVTQIPTLFERYSQDEMMLQSFQSSLRLRKMLEAPCLQHLPRRRKPKPKPKRQSSSSLESYVSLASSSGSSASTLSRSSSSGKQPCSGKHHCSSGKRKKKTERGPLKVSINEKAELIEDRDDIQQVGGAASGGASGGASGRADEPDSPTKPLTPEPLI